MRLTLEILRQTSPRRLEVSYAPRPLPSRRDRCLWAARQRAPVPRPVGRQHFVRVNHTARRICVGTLIRNYGGGPPGRPWQLAIGITFVKAGVTISSQELFTISQNQVIGSDGFESPCSE